MAAEFKEHDDLDKLSPETDYDESDDGFDLHIRDAFVPNDEMNKIAKARKEELQSIHYWMIYEVQLPEYVKVFMEHGYDSWISIQNITDKELLEIGIMKQGHRKKILKYISMIRTNEFVCCH